MTGWRAACAAVALFGAAVTEPPVRAVAVAQDPRAQPPLTAIPLTLVTRASRRTYRVEVARTPAEQAAGMMFRTRMPRDTGMIFPMAPARRAAFWMENTVLPLDLVFIAGGRVESIAPDATPYSRAFIPSRGAVDAVLELNGGEAARIGLKPGDRVLYRLPA